MQLIADRPEFYPDNYLETWFSMIACNRLNRPIDKAELYPDNYMETWFSMIACYRLNRAMTIFPTMSRYSFQIIWEYFSLIDGMGHFHNDLIYFTAS